MRTLIIFARCWCDKISDTLRRHDAQEDTVICIYLCASTVFQEPERRSSFPSIHLRGTPPGGQEDREEGDQHSSNSASNDKSGSRLPKGILKNKLILQHQTLEQAKEPEGECQAIEQRAELSHELDIVVVVDGNDDKDNLNPCPTTCAGTSDEGPCWQKLCSPVALRTTGCTRVSAHYYSSVRAAPLAGSIFHRTYSPAHVTTHRKKPFFFFGEREFSADD